MENKGKKGEKGCNVSFRSAYQREDSNSGRDAFFSPSVRDQNLLVVVGASRDSR